MTPNTLRLRIAANDSLTDLELTAESEDCRDLPPFRSWYERAGEVVDDLMGAFLTKSMPEE